jgi:hypothetical protein
MHTDNKTVRLLGAIFFSLAPPGPQIKKMSFSGQPTTEIGMAKMSKKSLSSLPHIRFVF